MDDALVVQSDKEEIIEMNNGCICCTGKLPCFRVVFCVTATARLVCTHGINLPV